MWTDLLSYVVDHATALIGIATSLVGGFALIATLTPNKVDDKVGQAVMDLINFLGANWGKAKNRE